MKTKVDAGQITLYLEELRIQFYWPHFIWKNIKKTEYSWSRDHKEFFFSAATNFRIVWEEKYYWGFGGNVLGFGAAVDYQKQEKKS